MTALVTDGFAISRDLWKVSPITIHTTDCEWYSNRKVDASTMEWKVVSNFEDAEKKAQEMAREDGVKYKSCYTCGPAGTYDPAHIKSSQTHRSQKCRLCGHYVMGARTREGGEYRFYNVSDGSLHKHITIPTTNILGVKHYSSSTNEDKARRIGDLSVVELENKISEIATRMISMKFGTYLHAIHGFPDLGYEQNYFSRKITINRGEYYITAKLDKLEEDTIFEAKFPSSTATFKKNLEYAKDQCDIYGWITGLSKCKIVIHVINTNKTTEIDHVSDHTNGERLVREHIGRFSQK